MNATQATTILKILESFPVGVFLANGALDALAALQKLTIPPTNIYIIVPFTPDGGLVKVNAIKTLRVMFGLGLKEAKDIIDVELPKGTSVRCETAIRIGPFHSSDVAGCICRLEDARNQGQTGILEAEVE